MATYIELIGAASDSTLKQRIAVACVIAAEAIRTEDPGTPNHVNRLVWAKRVYQAPEVAASSMIWPVLAQNAAIPVASIIGASDAAVLTAVQAAVAVFVE